MRSFLSIVFKFAFDVICVIAIIYFIAVNYFPKFYISRSKIYEQNLRSCFYNIKTISNVIEKV